MATILDRPVPPKPGYFGPDGAPVGVTLRLDAYARLDDGYAWKASRPKIQQRMGVVHTNAASRSSPNDAQEAWGRNTSTDQGRNTTKPHYLVDGVEARKVLPTDLRGIANSTGSAFERAYNEKDSSLWSFAIETADLGSIEAKKRGYNWPTDCGPFLNDDQMDWVAQILAYESIVGGYPIKIPTVWNDTGVITHTWPFPYPAFTTRVGKTCPGSTKKTQFRTIVVPRAAQIRAAWLAPNPEPPTEEEDEPMFRYRNTDYLDQFAVGASGAIKMTPEAVKLPYFKDLPLVENADRAFLVICCNSSGFDFADLTPA